MNKKTDNQFDFWQDHSLNFLEMALRTDKREIIAHPDGYGKNTRACGDSVEMFVTVRKGVIKYVSFNTRGCIYTCACSNTVATMAEGKTIQQAFKITAEKVIAFLETLPSAEAHCARLAVGSFRKALKDFLKTEKEPWKRLYQR